MILAACLIVGLLWLVPAFIAVSLGGFAAAIGWLALFFWLMLFYLILDEWNISRKNDQKYDNDNP
ncbi:MAG: hypothetical protein PHN47_05860 [Clostridia bacterium]|jgi:hypothetical protein|nr:hypothetical protein [Clostridia bacterium]MDD4571990.1 hypothetical protein [Clostridia bacterium]